MALRSPWPPGSTSVVWAEMFFQAGRGLPVSGLSVARSGMVAFSARATPARVSGVAMAPLTVREALPKVAWAVIG